MKPILQSQPSRPVPDRSGYLCLYERMVRIRRFELAAQKDYKAGRMPGFIHLHMGEEAVAAGVCAHLRRDDWVTSTHRGHGHALAKGVSSKALMAELHGRVRLLRRARREHIGAEIAAAVMAEAFDELDAPVGRLHPDPVTQPSSRWLENEIVVTIDKIVAAAGFDMDRQVPPPLHAADLAGIDFCLVTHSHQDHLDPETLSGCRYAGGRGPYLARRKRPRSFRRSVCLTITRKPLDSKPVTATFETNESFPS